MKFHLQLKFISLNAYLTTFLSILIFIPFGILIKLFGIWHRLSTVFYIWSKMMFQNFGNKTLKSLFRLGVHPKGLKFRENTQNLIWLHMNDMITILQNPTSSLSSQSRTISIRSWTPTPGESHRKPIQTNCTLITHFFRLQNTNLSRSTPNSEEPTFGNDCLRAPSDRHRNRKTCTPSYA